MLIDHLELTATHQPVLLVRVFHTAFLQEAKVSWTGASELWQSYSVSGKSPVNNYLFKVNNRNSRKRCKICSKLTITLPERRLWCCY